jgi:hypothetical protein
METALVQQTTTHAQKTILSDAITMLARKLRRAQTTIRDSQKTIVSRRGMNRRAPTHSRITRRGHRPTMSARHQTLGRMRTNAPMRNPTTRGRQPTTNDRHRIRERTRTIGPMRNPTTRGRQPTTNGRHRIRGRTKTIGLSQMPVQNPRQGRTITVRNLNLGSRLNLSRSHGKLNPALSHNSGKLNRSHDRKLSRIAAEHLRNSRITNGRRSLTTMESTRRSSCYGLIGHSP